MRLVCHLREIRGKRRVEEIATASGVHRGTLSRIERGLQLPTTEQLPKLEAAYGVPRQKWYSELALLAIQEDVPE